ncbi:MAG TPA: hypothetical protein VFZ78_03000, partial [Flavisolibacter sp.]
MRKYQFMLVLLLAGTTAFSQNIATDTSAQVIAWWRKGEVKNLVISKTTEKKDNGKVVQRTSGSYGATITVIDSTAEGYTLQWQYHYKAAAGQTELQVYEKMLDELKVIYKTSDVGDFEEVVNFNEMRLFIDKTIGELKKSIRDTAALNAIMPQVQQ